LCSIASIHAISAAFRFIVLAPVNSTNFKDPQ
jgi:hypothetical protein